MKNLYQWNNDITNSVSVMMEEVGKIVPKLVAAIVILIVGWLITKLVVKVIKRTLKFVKADKLDDKINEIELF